MEWKKPMEWPNRNLMMGVMGNIMVGKWRLVRNISEMSREVSGSGKSRNSKQLRMQTGRWESITISKHIRKGDKGKFPTGVSINEQSGRASEEGMKWLMLPMNGPKASKYNRSSRSSDRSSVGTIEVPWERSKSEWTGGYGSHVGVKRTSIRLLERILTTPSGSGKGSDEYEQ
ncbi:hypothetical protein DFH05DRAFT_1459913 [Lentinula detonsa]|uniref:Uncharacterized protein n=1 Tax=Lentinula detonsa TaxID=2804962 RepID=A0A9W8P1K5_9AGAR|nr:hypothetical protein DFH05DRAFT_1459913 [Lentinula detonsa]